MSTGDGDAVFGPWKMKQDSGVKARGASPRWRPHGFVRARVGRRLLYIKVNGPAAVNCPRPAFVPCKGGPARNTPVCV